MWRNFMKWISETLVFVALTVYERNASFCILFLLSTEGIIQKSSTIVYFVLFIWHCYWINISDKTFSKDFSVTQCSQSIAKAPLLFSWMHLESVLWPPALYCNKRWRSAHSLAQTARITTVVSSTYIPTEIIHSKAWKHKSTYPYFPVFFSLKIFVTFNSMTILICIPIIWTNYWSW